MTCFKQRDLQRSDRTRAHRALIPHTPNCDKSLILFHLIFFVLRNIYKVNILPSLIAYPT